MIDVKQKCKDLDAYVQYYIDDGFDYGGVSYSRDRSMLTYKGRVIRQFSFADLHQIGAIFKSKDIRAKDVYQDLVLCVIPNRTHLLSMLMDD